MRALAFVFILAISLNASAYFVAVPKAQAPLDYNQPVRVLVSGRGADLGDQPMMSALGRSLLYKRNFSADQQVLISVFETTGNTEEKLRAAGWIFLTKNDLKFETNVATKEILKFNKIRSLEFFGHNSPSLGTQTDGLGYRFDFRLPVVATLKTHFMKGAYAIVHGCNSGWLIAQDMSKVWNIAFAGSFTGTRFERLHSDGHFYVWEDGRYPNENWAQTNDDLKVSCSQGGCLRMRPMFSHYDGKWGDFSGPLLSHYKFFCQLGESECEKTMASSLYGYLAEKSLRPDSSLNEFREVAQQYLCPVYKDHTIVENCYKQLDLVEAGHALVGFSFVVNDQQLSCNLKSCTGKMTCIDHNCTVADRVSKGANTLADEYMHLLNGFKLLQQEGL